jgi:hypothetical protein
MEVTPLFNLFQIRRFSLLCHELLPYCRSSTPTEIIGFAPGRIKRKISGVKGD